MMEIKLSEIMDNKTYPESGKCFFRILSDAMTKNDGICINMQGVSSLPSLFLNVSIGRIICDHGYDILKSVITFKNINKSQAERIQDYIDKVKDTNKK